MGAPPCGFYATNEDFRVFYRVNLGMESPDDTGSNATEKLAETRVKSL